MALTLIKGGKRTPATPPKTRRGAGRPTKEQAEQRHQELLDRALELFLENGFELATIDAIAASVGMAKRTVYSLYKDKTALFKATVQRAIERWAIPVETYRAAETDDLEATLTATARIHMTNSVSPAGLRLQRIINAESYRFPEMFSLAYEQGAHPTIEFLADLLQRHAAMGTIKVQKPELTAAVFLAMIAGGPVRAIVLGKTVPNAALEERIRICVKMFLDGVRPR